jgi:hypothetical protein
MVHALSEIHRVLRADGTLIDLRPVDDRWPVEVSSKDGIQQTGRLIDHPKVLEDDAAAEDAMNQVKANGWFKREEITTFPLSYSWDTPKEMENYIDEEWEDENALDESTKVLTRSAWASAGPDARPRITLKMSIALWKNI